MKTIRLKKLHLYNFRAINDLAIEPKGGDVLDILGKNGTGKTTIADGISWLFWGKDSHGNAKFDIKTLDENNEPINFLDHTVHGILEIDKGGDTIQLLELTKTLKENWVKHRGATEKTFEGHVTEYFINGVSVGQRKYKDKIAEIIDEETFKQLTDPRYFAQKLPWEKRRETLLKFADVTDQDVIDSLPELQPLTEMLAQHNLDDNKKMIKAEQTKINGQIEEIPIQIQEASRAVSDIESDSLEEEEAGKKFTTDNLEKLQAEKTKLESGLKSNSLQEELADAKQELAEVKTAHTEGLDKLAADKQKQADAIVGQIGTFALPLATKRAKLQTRKEHAPKDNREEIRAELDKLIQEWEEIDSRTYEYAGSSCPNCGHHLDNEEEALTKFNQRKSADLEANEAKGKELKAQLDDAEQNLADNIQKNQHEVANLEAEINKLVEEEKSLTIEHGKLCKEISDIKAIPILDKPDFMAATAKIDDIEKRIEKAAAGDNTQEIEAITEKIEGLEKSLESIIERISNIKQNQKQRDRVEELKEKEAFLSAEYQKLQDKLDLIEEFEKQRATMLDDKVSSMFKMARFRLFKKQINEGLQPCCDILYKGVPFSTGLNTGAQINVGLDIINTLSDQFQVKVPIVVDGAESLTSWIDTDTQMIRMIASPDFDELTIRQ